MNLALLVIGASFIGAALTPAKVLAWSCDSECESNQSECLSWKRLNCPPRNQLYPGWLRFPGQRFYQRSPSYLQESDSDVKSFGGAPESRLAVRASRAFAGPGQYPPSGFAAYGIIAFQSQPYDTDETNRYRNICRGYLAAIPASKILLYQKIPLNKQMVTVWPLNDVRLSNALNITDLDHDAMCRRAIRSIDLVASRNSLAKARAALRKESFDGRGPYVLAWSPAQSFGKAQAAVLVLNLSGVSTGAQAADMFREWSNKIEQNPELWARGWNPNALRVTLRLWADRWGPGILSLFSPQK
jgi:hypothetical protein